MAAEVAISIVIPVYNSEKILPELFRQLTDALKGHIYEAILVNDESADQSWNVILAGILQYPQLVGINLRKNSGQDNAIMAGLKISRGKYVVIMDDDLQHSPHDITTLINACEQAKADVCFARFPQQKQALWKRLGSWFNGKVANIIIRKPSNIYLSPFKLLKQEIVQEIVKYDGPYPYVDGILFTITRNVTQVDVNHNERFFGKGNYTFTRSLKVFMKLATNFSVFPLRIVSILGSLIAFSGFLLGLYYLIEYFISSKVIEGWTTLVILILILGGTNLIFIGLIGEYTGRAYLSINKRPQYTIKDIVLGGGIPDDTI
ncbi:MAG: glycosyltransferase [Spirochaetaceae bacterium]|jgi:undecaprenyl-phosphate 4-deoxy-4-formamido-L-arabinose transferase|nr:glycosyltransferase [Spirochaetaceae bacterium]